MGDISPHFNRKEFACKCGCGKAEPSDALVYALEAIREHFKESVIINSAHRCTEHNKSVGGAVSSQHLFGFAADIRVKGIRPAIVQEYADKLIGDRGGVGSYIDFTHVDVRGYKARWKG